MAHDYDAAVALSKTSDKPLFIDIGATYCSACVMLDKQIFAKEIIQKALQSYVHWPSPSSAPSKPRGIGEAGQLRRGAGHLRRSLLGHRHPRGQARIEGHPQGRASAGASGRRREGQERRLRKKAADTLKAIQ